MPDKILTPQKKGGSNDFQTPPNALKPLLPFLPKEWKIWECAEGEGHLVNEFRRLGYPTIGSDILSGNDFLKWKLQDDEFDCIVTNPPYSLKQEFLTRCYELGKPFALLLPLTTFETTKRQELFQKHGVQVIFFDVRINFKTPDGGGGGAWFATAWFTNGLNLPKDMMFVKYDRTGDYRSTVGFEKKEGEKNGLYTF